MSTLSSVTRDEKTTTKDDAQPPTDAFEVVLEEADDPQNIPAFRKWLAVVVISSAALCVACASSTASFTEIGIAQEFHVSHEISILGISLFVEGLGWGPLLVGPLSEVYGRNPIYYTSYALLFIFSWPIAFAPNIVVFLVFRFVTGFCGSAFLSVAGGSVSDLFSNAAVANPMALYTISPFLGPVAGPFISGFVNQHLYWRWTYRIALIWIFAELLALILFVPETYVPVILKRKAARFRRTTGKPAYFTLMDRSSKSLGHEILVSCYRPFQLMLFDRMALLLNLWTALILGILYLAFQAFPIIFQECHNFTVEQTGLAFLGIGLGMIFALSTQPIWNRMFVRACEKHNGNPPPETRLIMGQVGGILVPVGLFALAFTTYSSVHWIVPIIASIPFGAGIYFVFMSTFTYLVTVYRPIAASAMASNSAMRSAFAAVLPLCAGPMYRRMGTVGATVFLASLMSIMAPLPFIFFRIGERLRKKSRFAVS